jgi:hypothetical protein
VASNKPEKINLPHSVPKGPKSGKLKTRKGRASLKTRKGRASLKTREGLVQGNNYLTKNLSSVYI